MPFGSADCICFSIFEIADALRIVIDFKLSFLNLKRNVLANIQHKSEFKRKYRVALPSQSIKFRTLIRLILLLERYRSFLGWYNTTIWGLLDHATKLRCSFEGGIVVIKESVHS